jgi:hypothetical protein
MSNTQRPIQPRITGRSFTSADPERQREIATESPRGASDREARAFRLRTQRPPHMAWMAPDVDYTGSSRRSR